ncbi:SseB family protein [Sphaerisporangium sp. NPDC051017]|uniref:SseB family protein n=1 Tax=Sphaerisporangium sp. NPDC051017 TaxID=3154636 RepID=UPI00341CFA9E
MRDWEPAGPFEVELAAAFAEGDLARCLILLRRADLALPIGPDAAAGRAPVAWPTASDAERTWIVAYTSAEAMRARVGGLTGHHRIVSLAEMAAGWPDLRWGLAVNPGLPVNFFLEPGTVARLAVPSLADDRAADPGAGTPVVQKLLTPADLYAYLAEGRTRVSGYCHHALDVAHIATPVVLADALARSRDEGVVTDEGSVHILRWHAVGTALYRTPYGGTDEETRAAVAGWVIEEPPFAGMGLVPNVDQVIREYKIDGVGLPHGAEIWELTAAGVEHRRALYDGDLERWMLVHAADPAGHDLGDPARQDLGDPARQDLGDPGGHGSGGRVGGAR